MTDKASLSRQQSNLSPAKQALLQQRLQKAASASGLAQVIQPRSDAGPAPLSFTQERMWFLDRYQPGSAAFNRPLALRFKGELSHIALEQALNEIIRRHQILRTTFPAQDGQPVQIIRPPQPVTLAVVDISNQPAERQNIIAGQVAVEETRRSFDLSTGPLFRATLLRLDKTEHVLLVVIHHIAFDGWSATVFKTELATLYNAHIAGKTPLLSELPIQYADFAHWQREQLKDERLQSLLAYWQAKLAGAPPALELPTDRPRPALHTYNGARHHLLLSAGLSQSLKTLSRQEGVTLFTTLLAAFGVLLSRYSRQDDIVVGSPIAGRLHPETEQLIGCFINTLALRANLAGNPSFQELLQQIHQTTLEALDHQALPFEKLVEHLKPRRDPSRTPIFQVIFNLENIPEDKTTIHNLVIEPFEFDANTTGVDLSLEVIESRAGMHCWFEYNTDLFEAATIERMAGYFQTLLEGAVSNPAQPIARLPLLSQPERHRLLVEWNDTRADYPQHLCVHHLFEAQAQRTPQAIAVVFDDHHLTYGDLNRQANQLAHYLHKLGVGPEVLVGVCLERSIEMIVAILAILKAGGAYVPLDPTYPQERLAFMLADSATPVVLTQSRLLANLPDSPARTVCLDADRPAWLAEAPDNPATNILPANLAYVIYTSGSTGRPKGTAISHHSLLNLVYWHQRAFAINPTDRATQLAALSFDASVWEIWPYLAAGASVHFVPDEETRTSPQLLQHWLIAQHITVTFVPTPLAERLLQLDWRRTSLRLMLTGGDRLTYTPAATLPFTVVNNYGPTEYTVVTTSARLNPHQPAPTPPPIGRPIANTQVFLLDHHLQPVPVGLPGELCIAGHGLARTYLNRPDLTAEKFIPNPFSSTPGERLYKTGDLARYLPDGNIEFLGRIDQQLKIRGFRVEPGEIEATLRQHPAVQEAVVSAHQFQPEDKRLVAYFVANQARSVTVADLTRYLKDRLPHYLLPSVLIPLDNLPLTPNGKINRQALPAPEYTRSELETPFAAPRSPVEEVLTGIWSEILGMEQVGIDDNFFELGGHSLLATRVMSRVQTVFQISLPLRTLFEKPTVAHLAQSVEAACRAKQSLPENISITPPPRGHKLPLSFAQQRLWFLEQLEFTGASYNISQGFQLAGSLDTTALEQSLDTIIQRHEALRTTFGVVEGEPVQLINPQSSFKLNFIDLQHLPPSEQETEVQQLAAQEAAFSFDLTQGPLFRATLLQLNSKKHVLFLTMHHIISDGWSMSVLYRELSALYKALAAGEASPLPLLPLQYADFAAWQNRWLNDKTLTIQLDYWKQQLNGAPSVLELPSDKQRPAVQSFNGGKQSVTLSQPLTQAIKKLSHQQNATLFMTLLAAFKLLLFRYTQQKDIVVGTPIAGRRWPETEDLIGFFINSLVLRTNLSANPSFEELLGRVREVALQAFMHQDVPFEKLLEELQPQRDLSHTPLFQVFFNMSNFEDTRLELPGLEVEQLKPGGLKSLFDLTLYVKEQNNNIRLNLVYNADLFSPARMAEMLGQYHHLLNQIVENPQTPITQFSLVTPAARSQLPDPARPLQTRWHGAVHTRFSQQAQQLPTQPAVIDWQDRWTYQELDTRSSQLAHYLRANGINHQDVIAIYGHRSASLVWAILGALKAGAAFTILDPAHPASRLIEYLKITNPKGWLQLEAASPPRELETFIAAQPGLVRLTLPALNQAQAGNFLNEYPASGPHITVGPDDTAYIAFTSGSTGQPKGVIGRHGPLSHFLPWQTREFDLTPSDRFSMLSGLSHDPLQRDIFTALWVGATICIPEANIMSLSSRLAAWMADQGITFAHLTPAMAQVLTENPPPNHQLTALRYAFFVGDRLTRRDVMRLRHLAPNVTCINSYGSTETQRAVGYYRVPTQLEPDKATYSLGRGMPNVQLLVLNQQQQLAGIGELGEIYVRSPHLAKGYLNDALLTQMRFIANPFTQIANDRLYKTGDLGRYLPDGTLEFAGRADRQIKIRGFRIEPEEIEHALVQHPDIQEAVVVLHEGRSGRKHLVAYLIPVEGTTPFRKYLRNFLWQKLPDYMIPAVFVLLESLPLTPNGKIDYAALPEPVPLRSELQSTFVAPKNIIERKLVKIWEEVLEIRPIGIKDSFFELGGHSLLAVRLFSRIEQEFGKNLPLVCLFKEATIEHLANLIRQQAGLTIWSSLVDLQPIGNKPPFFCVHGLTGDVLWFAALARHLAPEQPFYGLQARGLDGVQEPFTQIEAMAAHYITEMRALQPEGPYYLGGASFGGTVALEMARQLQAQGQQVALLATFDHTPPNINAKNNASFLISKSATLASFFKNLPYWFGSFMQLTPYQMLARIRRKTRVAKKRFDHKFNLRNLELDRVDAADIIDYAAELPEHRRRLIEAHYQAIKNYRPQPYNGSVTLFRARSRPAFNSQDPEIGWKKIAGDNVEVNEVPGSHEGMFKEPYVRTLAAALKANLERAQAATQGHQPDS